MLLAGCDSVLGISEPRPRPDEDAGVGGSAGSSGAAGSAGAAGAAGSPEPPCTTGEQRCAEGNVPETCEDGAWRAGTVCAAFCLDGACVTPPSCAGPLICANGVSCCQALEVPGGSFIRDFDDVTYTDDNYHATVSSFLLDTFEVTVGRLRKFVGAYSNIDLQPGDGKAPHIVEDRGWRAEYDAKLPSSADELRAMLSCPGATWSGDDISGDQRPANCVTFYVAYAFCIWDGGRLATEAEWNYAAAGGDEQRVYPWSVPPGSTEIRQEQAYFEASGPPLPVGSKPLGAGRWGQLDLAGNVYEMVLDYHSEAYPSTMCLDCLNDIPSEHRRLRGGGYPSIGADLMVSRNDDVMELDATRGYAGFRCVRDLTAAGAGAGSPAR